MLPPRHCGLKWVLYGYFSENKMQKAEVKSEVTTNFYCFKYPKQKLILKSSIIFLNCLEVFFFTSPIKGPSKNYWNLIKMTYFTYLFTIQFWFPRNVCVKIFSHKFPPSYFYSFLRPWDGKLHLYAHKCNEKEERK